jgi:diguanylate cyclase (GGDEF)-like protein
LGDGAVDTDRVIADRQALKASVLRVAPFAGACCLAWAAVLVGSSIVWWEYWLSFVVVWVACGVALLGMVDRRRSWLAVVPSALLLLAGVGLLRDSAGGISSGASALAILPVFQVALYSRSRRDLGIVLFGVALFFLIPIWVVGDPAYPNTQYRTVVLVVAVDAIIGLATQALVARTRSQAWEAEARERMLEQVTTVVHNLFDSLQPRRDACHAAMTIGEALSATLYEPLPDSDQLVCTAFAGIKTKVLGSVVPRRSAAYDAMRTRRPVLITEDVGSYVGLVDVWIAEGRPDSLLYQPLLRGGRPLGVLIICWPDHVRSEGPRAKVVALLAHEVAAVISRADALDHLNDEALTDALTGLPNRRAWERQLRELTGAGKQFALSILDLDRFKQFNDTHGHPAGDRLLKETAAAWRDQLRPGDILARVGGEEFGLLLLDCAAHTASDVVDRLRSRVTHDQTCSAGIAIREPAETSEAAVERADAALYQAKARGRNQSFLASPDAFVSPQRSPDAEASGALPRR